MLRKTQASTPVAKEKWAFKKHGGKEKWAFKNHEGSPPPPPSVKYITKSHYVQKLNTISEEPGKWFTVK